MKPFKAWLFIMALALSALLPYMAWDGWLTHRRTVERAILRAEAKKERDEAALDEARFALGRVADCLELRAEAGKGLVVPAARRTACAELGVLFPPDPSR